MYCLIPFTKTYNVVFRRSIDLALAFLEERLESELLRLDSVMTPFEIIPHRKKDPELFNVAGDPGQIAIP